MTATSPPPEDQDHLVVRSATIDDVARIVELIDLGSLTGPREDRSDLADYELALADILDTPGCEVLVVEHRGRVVGTTQLITFRHLQMRGGRCAEIESMHVEPGLRSLGIGGVLLEAAVERAVALGCYRVQLTSNKARVDAHRFYARHGFVASHEGFKRVLEPDR